MEYKVMIRVDTDKKGASHRKCLITLPYDYVRDAGLTGTAKDRTANVEYDSTTKSFKITKAR